MRIWVTANAAWNVWHFRRAVVAALLADGHEVTILAPPDEAVPLLEGIGCAFLPLAMDASGLNPLRDAALLARLSRRFARGRPDFVLSYTIKNNLYGALAATTLGVPFIPNVSGLGTAFLSGGLLETVAQALYRVAFRRLPVVFFQNEDDRQLFVARGLVRAAQARRLPGSGINLAHFRPAPLPAGGETVFLLVARLLKDKGVLEFVEAARQLRARHPAARFRLLGAADAANRTAITEDTARGWAATHGVDYLGSAEDVRPHLAAAHCVVLPSYREGAPRSLIEGAAMARPLIATDVPGCRSVVEEGVSGLLCEVRSAESLAGAMERFLGLTRAQQAAMGAAGRAKMEREFDEAQVVAAYRAAIAEVAGGM